MTKDKAIELLDNLIGVVEDNHGSDYDKAIHMAIDALTADMDDLISRQAAIDAIRKDIMGGLNYESILKELPSAQPERKKGEWTQNEMYEEDWNIYVCSNCGEAQQLIAGTPTDNNYNFCPNCGADMRGDKT